MKTATVAQAQANLEELLQIVESGGEAGLIRGRRPVARIVPLSKRDRKKLDWSTTWKKIDLIFEGKSAPGKPGSQIIIEGRR
jgi:antitoxin (DNA-binding transcriptional repressor) of toxin-antitoxin stability system